MQSWWRHNVSSVFFFGGQRKCAFGVSCHVWCETLTFPPPASFEWWHQAALNIDLAFSPSRQSRSPPANPSVKSAEEDSSESQCLESKHLSALTTDGAFYPKWPRGMSHELHIWLKEFRSSKGGLLLLFSSGQQFAQQIQQQNPELIEQLRNHIRSRSFSGSAEEHSWSDQVEISEHNNNNNNSLKKCDFFETISSFPTASHFSKKGQPQGATYNLPHPFVRRVWSEWTGTKLKALGCDEERALEFEAGRLKRTERTHNRVWDVIPGGNMSTFIFHRCHMPPPSFTPQVDSSVQSWRLGGDQAKAGMYLPRWRREGTLHLFSMFLSLTPPYDYADMRYYVTMSGFSALLINLFL